MENVLHYFSKLRIFLFEFTTSNFVVDESITINSNFIFHSFLRNYINNYQLPKGKRVRMRGTKCSLPTHRLVASQWTSFKGHRERPRSECPGLMEGERKVILSALTSVGYIGYYIVSVYKVYVHDARVQRQRFHQREKFFINGLRTMVYACVYDYAVVRRKYWFYRKLMRTKMLQLKGDASCNFAAARKGRLHELQRATVSFGRQVGEFTSTTMNTMDNVMWISWCGRNMPFGRPWPSTL